MHDLRAIRLDPTAYDKGWAARGLEPAARAVLSLDEERRGAQTTLQQAQARRKDLSALIGKAKAVGDIDAAEGLMTEVDQLKAVIVEQTAAELDVGQRLQDLLAGLPNLPADDVPVGEDERANLEVRRWGDPWTGGPA